MDPPCPWLPAPRWGSGISHNEPLTEPALCPIGTLWPCQPRHMFCGDTLAMPAVPCAHGDALAMSCTLQGHHGCASHALCPMGTLWLCHDFPVPCRDIPAVSCTLPLPHGDNVAIANHALGPMGTLWPCQPCRVPYGDILAVPAIPHGMPQLCQSPPCPHAVTAPGSVGL